MLADTQFLLVLLLCLQSSTVVFVNEAVCVCMHHLCPANSIDSIDTLSSPGPEGRG